MGVAIGGGILSILAMLMSFGQLAYLEDVATTGTLSAVPAIEPDPKPVAVGQAASTTLATQALEPLVTNIRGEWISEDGLTYLIRQNGENFSFIENNIFGAQVGSGEGVIQSDRVRYKYYNSLIDISGKGAGKVDGNVMYLRFTDENDNSFSYELYRD